MIKGDMIYLRALELADADILYEWENDMKLWHLSNTLTPFSRFTIEQYVMNAHEDLYTSKQLRLMIDLKEEPGTSIGTIDLFEFEPSHKRAGIGILVLEQYRRKGYASEAIGLICGYADKTLGLHQVFANISSSNEESLNLFKKKGFEVTGIKKDWNLKYDHWEDEILLQKILKN